MSELLLPSIMQSIKPQYCELIASGKKTIEVRKTKPKIPTPFKVYIYCTKEDKTPFLLPTYSKGNLTDSDIWKMGNGKVIGEYVCNKIDKMSHCGNCSNDIKLRLLDEYFCAKDLDWEYLNNCRLSYADLVEYSNGGNIYGWHISDLKIYDKPKELSEFRKLIDCHRGNEKHQCIGCWDCEIKRPPQSWCYVEEANAK